MLPYIAITLQLIACLGFMFVALRSKRTTVAGRGIQWSHPGVEIRENRIIEES